MLSIQYVYERMYSLIVTLVKYSLIQSGCKSNYVLFTKQMFYVKNLKEFVTSLKPNKNKMLKEKN